MVWSVPGAGCKLVRCEPVQARMGPREIVIDPPIFDQVSGMPIAGKQVLVETLVSEPADKALHQPVLPGAM